MAQVKVEDVSWDSEAVAAFGGEKEFVSAQLADAGTYPLLPDNKAREAALKLVYKLSVPNKPPKTTKTEAPAK